MYYISDKIKECQDYNDKVISGEGYKGKTRYWAKIIELPHLNKFAIKAHENYTSKMGSPQPLPPQSQE